MIAGILTYADRADAVDATLTIKVRLVKCISPLERRTMCSSENLCCEFIDGFAATTPRQERLETLAMSSVPRADAIWISDPDKIRRVPPSSP
jgi:hypothetical protein